MKFKKLLASAAAAVTSLGIALLPASDCLPFWGGMGVFASAEEDKIVDSLKYVVRESIAGDSTVEITGYVGSGGEVVIPAEIEGLDVTSIGTGAFSGFSTITSVIIPDSVTNIGDSAFQGCSGLTSLTLPQYLGMVGESAFAYCSALESLELPETVTDIGKRTFMGCETLTEITIPDNVVILETDAVETYGNSMFSGCTALETVYIGKSVTTISGSMFTDCPSLTAVNVSDGNTMFRSSDGGVVYTNDFTSLLVYPEGRPGDTFTLRAEVDTIDTFAFVGNANLWQINVDRDNVNFSSNNGVLFDYGGTTLLRYPSGINDTNGVYSIPAGTTTVAGYAFYNNENLTHLVLPEKLETIENYAFDGVALEEAYYLGANWSSVSFVPDFNNGLAEARKHTGHGYDEFIKFDGDKDWNTNETEHWRECPCTTPQQFFYGLHTYNEDGFCTVCGTPYQGVEINEINFPDKTFRDYVTEFDVNKDSAGNTDGVLYPTEIDDVLAIDTGTASVKDFTGIEHLTYVTSITSAFGGSKLELGSLPKLTNVKLTDCNKLVYLDVSKNSELTNLDVEGASSFLEIDLKANTKLTNLTLDGCTPMTALDLGGCASLETVKLTGMDRLIKLNLKGCTELGSLTFHGTALKELDLSENTKLTTLVLGDMLITDWTGIKFATTNPIENLTLSGLPNMRVANVDGFTALKSLKLENGIFTHADVKAGVELTTMNNVREIVPTAGIFNLKSLEEEGFDLSKTDKDKWVGATCHYDTGLLDGFTSDIVSYSYECATGKFYEFMFSVRGVSGGGIAINSSNFPDDALRNKVDAFDLNDDGSLSTTEIGRAKQLEVKDCTSLEGIEYLTSLTELKASGTFNRVDLGANKDLTLLHLSSRLLKMVDVSMLTNLEELHVTESAITSLNLNGTKVTSTRFVCTDNEYVIGGPDTKTFDLKILEAYGLDTTNVSEWQGAEYIRATHTLINIKEDVVYEYDCSGGHTDDLKAEFKLVRRDESFIKVTIPEHVSVTLDGKPLANGDTVMTGDRLSITVTPPEGYTLVSLMVNGTIIRSATDVYNYTVRTEDVVISTDFAKQVTVTFPTEVTVNANGRMIKSGDKVNEGTRLTIVADVPSSSYKLKELKVNGADIANGGAYVAGTQDIEITVKFTALVKVTFPKDVSVRLGTGFLTSGDKIDEGEKIIITATIPDPTTQVLTSLMVNGSEITNGFVYIVGNKDLDITVAFAELRTITFPEGVNVNLGNRTLKSGSKVPEGSNLDVTVDIPNGFEMKPGSLRANGIPIYTEVPLPVNEKDIIITVEFTPISEKQFVSIPEGVKVTRDNVTLLSGSEVAKDDVLKITAGDRDGYDFGYLMINGGEKHPEKEIEYTVPDDENVIIFARYIPYLTVTYPENLVFVTRAREEKVPNGDKVITGERLMITVTSNLPENTMISSLKVNGIEINSGSEYIVAEESVVITAEVSALAPQVVTFPQNVTVTRGGEELESGTGIMKGDELVISAVPPKNHGIKLLTVNGSDFGSGNTYTVIGFECVEVAVEFEKLPQKLYFPEEYVTVTRGEEALENEALLADGDELVITLTEDAVQEGAKTILTVNGTEFASGSTYTVSEGDSVNVTVGFAYTITIPEGVLVTRGGAALNDGDNIFVGDELVITALIPEKHILDFLTVNDADFESGSTYTLETAGDIEIKVGFKAQVTVTFPETVTVTKGDTALESGAVVTEGDELVITATAPEGQQLAALLVNDTVIESGSTYTVGIVDVVIKAEFVPLSGEQYVLVPPFGVVVTRGSEWLTGKAKVSEGDKLVISAVVPEGYTLKSLTVNSKEFPSGGTYTVGKESVNIVVAFSPLETGRQIVTFQEGIVEVMRGEDQLHNGDAIANGDVLDIAVINVPDDCVVKAIMVNGNAITGGTYTVNGNESVNITYKLSSAEAEKQVVTFQEAYVKVMRGGVQLHNNDEIAKGDVLTITVEHAPDGYTVDAVKVNGVELEGSYYTVIGDESVNITLDVSPVEPAKQIVTFPEGYVKVMRGEEQLHDGDPIADGDVLTITPDTIPDDFILEAILVNDEEFTGDTYEVKDGESVKIDVELSPVDTGEQIVKFPEECVKVMRGEEQLHTGTTIYDGDVLTITLENIPENQKIKYFRVNGADFENVGPYFTVSNGQSVIIEVDFSPISPADQTVTFPEGVRVTRDGISIESGTIIEEGDELVIEAVVPENKVLGFLKVNGNDFESGTTYTVKGTENVVVEVKFSVQVKVTFPESVNVICNKMVLESGALVAEGDELKITAIVPDGYRLGYLKVNEDRIDNGSTYTVGTVDLVIRVDFVSLSEDLFISIPRGVEVTRGNEQLADGDKINTGDKLVIRAIPATGFRFKSLQVNDENFPNGGTYTVGSENVVITVEFERIPTKLTVTFPDRVIVTRTEKRLSSGDEIFTGDVLTVNAVIPNGSSLKSLKLNGKDFANGGRYVVDNESVVITVEFSKIPEMVKPISLTIATQPGKTVYYINESLNINGCTAVVTYSDGSSKTINVTNSMVYGFDSSSVGIKILTVKYEGLIATLEITVKRRPAVGAPGGGGSSGGSSGGSGGSRYPSINIDDDDEECSTSGGSIKGWDEVEDAIPLYRDGRTMVLELNSDTTVPASVLKALADNKANLRAAFDSTYTWVLSGSKISGPVGALNLSIDAAGYIPSYLIENVGGTAKNRLRLNSSDYYGAVLQVGISGGYYGQYASLMKYNASRSALEFVSSSQIDSSGTANLTPSGSGDYIVMVDTETKLFGDVNNDGTISVNDARDLLRYVVGLIDVSRRTRPDVNGDGKVNAVDAAYILRKLRDGENDLV